MKNLIGQWISAALLFAASSTSVRADWDIVGERTGSSDAASNEEVWFCVFPGNNPGTWQYSIYTVYTDAECHGAAQFVATIGNGQIRYIDPHGQQFDYNLTSMMEAFKKSGVLIVLQRQRDEVDEHQRKEQEAVAKSKKEAEERRKQEQQKYAADQDRRFYANRIRGCVQATRTAQETIDREREVEKISGYVDASLMHVAGQTIVDCRRNTPDFYSRYKAAGGTSSLEELQHGQDQDR